MPFSSESEIDPMNSCFAPLDISVGDLGEQWNAEKVLEIVRTEGQLNGESENYRIKTVYA